MIVSLIVPAHNEEDNISEVVERIESSIDIAYELVIVNDHSTDNTVSIVESLKKKYANLRLVDNKLSGSFANAIRTGFSNARGDLVVPIMGDLCDDLTTIKKMYEKINEGYDVVCGSRYMKAGRRIGGSHLKAFFSFFVGSSIFHILGIPTHDIANAFKMYRKKVLESIDVKSNGFEISMEIPLKAYYSGFKITEVPTVWHERTKGKSSFNMFKLSKSYFSLYLWAFYKRIKGVIWRIFA